MVCGVALGWPSAGSTFPPGAVRLEEETTLVEKGRTTDRWGGSVSWSTPRPRLLVLSPTAILWPYQWRNAPARSTARTLSNSVLARRTNPPWPISKLEKTPRTVLCTAGTSASSRRKDRQKHPDTPQMLSYGRKKLKNKAISYVDSYVPLGLTLGDLSASFRIEEDQDQDQNQDQNQDQQTQTSGTLEAEDSVLCDRVAARVLNQRRSKVSSSDSQNGRGASQDPDQSAEDEKNEDGHGAPSEEDEEDTTIEFVIPSRVNEDDDAPMVDTDMFIRGLTLLNMSLNNELIVKNPKNIRMITGQAIAHIVNSVMDPEALRAIMASLHDETKLQILKFYLSDDQLVNRLKSEQGLDLPNSSPPPYSSPPSSASSSSSYVFHRRSNTLSHRHPNEITLEQLILTLFQALYTFAILLYTRFGIPLLRLLWKLLLTLNNHYKLLDIGRALAIRTAAFMLNVFLKLILLCTNVVEETTLAPSPDPSSSFSSSSYSASASVSTAETAGNYARDAFFAIVQQGIVRASQKKNTKTTNTATPISAPSTD